ncbi:MAG TPA: C40 family peptidase [Pyrinomonadaceae bacterium]|jgi:peptidoglycan endopeptidase LytE
MIHRKLFPYAVTACFLVSIPLTALAQKGETRVRQATQLATLSDSEDLNLREDEAVVVSVATPDDIRSPRTSINTSSATPKFSFQQLMSAAIDDRLGARYRWGSEGPNTFDCSGFVWSIYQAAGINFERVSARSMWARFPAPSEDEKFKFGTLVFFSNLGHVGVVVDERGFYHASRRQGVIYSQFTDYWLNRLDGFRKVTIAPKAD